MRYGRTGDKQEKEPMKVNGIPTKHSSVDGGRAVEIIDQTQLPYRVEKRVLSDWRDCVEAISTMRVRGAPLIGVTGAWGVALAAQEHPENAKLISAAETIANARPTAVNLLGRAAHARGAAPRDPSLRAETAVKLAEEITQEDVLTCRAIGEAGVPVIAEPLPEASPSRQHPHALQRRVARHRRLRHGLGAHLRRL